jgi:large subunit ribosomal protein L24
MGVARKRHEPGTFKMHVRKGDTVLVLTGKDNGKRGRIIEALPRQERVIVEDVNLVTKHQKPRSLQPTARQQAGRVQMPAPLHVSNVQLVCPNCNRPTRIAHREVEGRSTRVCKHCGELVDKQK